MSERSSGTAVFLAGTALGVVTAAASLTAARYLLSSPGPVSPDKVRPLSLPLSPNANDEPRPCALGHRMHGTCMSTVGWASRTLRTVRTGFRRNGERRTCRSVWMQIAHGRTCRGVCGGHHPDRKALVARGWNIRQALQTPFVARAERGDEPDDESSQRPGSGRGRRHKKLHR